jgi:hypothetical protein
VATGSSRSPAPCLPFRVDTASSLGLTPSFRVLQASSRRRFLLRSRKRKLRSPRRHPPVRSLAPSASPRTGQRLLSSGPACLTGPPAPPGFLNLLALSSAPCLVALFHATSAHGVAPFRALLLPCSRTPSPTPSALLSLLHPLAQLHAHRKRPKPTTARSTSRPHQPKLTGTNYMTSTDRSRRTPGNRWQLTEATCNHAVSEAGPGAPSPSGLCSTRKSASHHRLFRPAKGT